MEKKSIKVIGKLKGFGMWWDEERDCYPRLMAIRGFRTSFRKF